MIRQTASVVTISLAVKPKSAREGPIGFGDDAKTEIRWAVHAPAEGGKANQALIESVAAFFDVRKSDVRILKGKSCRHKLVEISGLSAQAAGDRLGRALRS